MLELGSAGLRHLERRNLAWVADGHCKVAASVAHDSLFDQTWSGPVHEVRVDMVGKSWFANDLDVGHQRYWRMQQHPAADWRHNHGHILYFAGDCTLPYSLAAVVHKEKEQI